MSLDIDGDAPPSFMPGFGDFLRDIKRRDALVKTIAARIEAEDYGDDVVGFRRRKVGRSIGGPNPDGKARNGRTRELRVLTPADCAEAEPRGYLIKGFAAPGDLVLLFGQPGAGKSVIAPHIGYAVARGADVFGRRVRQGTVLYIAAEDPNGMRQRVHALRITCGDAPQFLLVDGINDLLNVDSRDADTLREMVDDIRPAMVIIDTVAAAFPGLRENEAEDMGAVVRLARSLTDTGAVVVLVHHAPKADDATPRGHGMLHGDADVGLRLVKTNGDVTGSFSKNRNGPSDAMLGFTIAAVHVGTDEDGDTITAPVLTEQEAKQPAKRVLTPLEHTARQYLADLIAKAGEPLPTGADFPQGMRGARENAWCEECESRRLSTADNEADRARSFRRAYSQLLGKKQVAARDGIVWLTAPSSFGRGDCG